jgi:hypothetical protein
MTTLQEVEGLISSMTAGEKAQLLRSSDKGIDRIWAEEAEKRVSEIDLGNAKLVPGEKVFARIRTHRSIT